MPLFDHFHGPLAARAWESFHSQWAGCIAADLNRRLPKHFVTDSPMHIGQAVAADVIEFEMRNGHEQGNGAPLGTGGEPGGVAVAMEPVLYSAPETDLSMSADFPTEIKVEVRDVTQAYRVVAVVELVSPSNKKEAGEREQFAAKCLSYLGKGIGLVVIDIVTERHWNLHNELVRVGQKGDKFLMAGDPPLYVAAYRPVHRSEKDLIDLWLWPLKLGEALPAVPLALKGYGCVRLDLEATYAEACTRLRIPG
jgi:hypothetical protein